MKYVLIDGLYKLFEDSSMYSIRSKKFLSQSESPTGYRYYQGSINREKKCWKVHRIVAEHFVPNPNNLDEVNHKDGNKANNLPSNLEWVTRGENIKHAYDNNLRSATGINNARCATDEQTVREICSYLSGGLSASEVRDLGYKYSLVRKIKSRENWSHISQDYSW